ncbi:polar growth protein [Aspergillus alliaceus]|uniref:Polar growth protein n=1 Tax=Petromyces alliaceus TaxID=209559 RepID=A0A8H5ZZ20_PETAA|nr:polar growth protein [Aspergillus burnettii]
MALTTPPRNVHPGDLLLVVHDFEARGPDELTLRRGEKIELVELDDGFGDGWYLGKDLNTGTQGLFPGVYTTVAPRIPIRPQKDTLESTTLKTDIHNVMGQDLVASPISGESTPQASRRASTSDMSVPDTDNMVIAPTPSPTQQQRSSSSPLPTSKMAIDIQKTIRQSIDGHLNGQDSPVMNETLSVIDEHITDLSTPRHSVTASQDSKTVNDSASEYSSTFEHRMSYINGHETDEEEERQPTEEEVRRWNHTETTKHLRQLGIEAKHCDIFDEQEITGDVILDMNQDFLFMKEFDFGVMGRRLKTWHKIKAFQEEVKGIQQQQSSRGSSFATPQDERAPSRAGHTGPLFPRIPTLRGSTSSTQHPRLISSTMQTSTGSPLTPQAPGWMDHSRRPSAASVREINHSRRHSSIDATNRYSGVGDSSPAGHHKKGSFDRGWTLHSSSGSQRRPGTAIGAPSETPPLHAIFHGAEPNGSDAATVVSDDLDRGYFSGPEGDIRKNRRVLQKRSSAHGSISTPSSIPDEQFKLKVSKRHSRINSADSIRDAVLTTPPAVKASPPKGRFRSLSTRATDRHCQRSSNPASVEEKSTSSGFFAAFSLGGKHDQESSHRSSPLPLQGIKNAGPKFRRAVGLRAMSEAVKGIDTSVAPPSPSKEAESPSARTGSTTPSTTKSSERHSTDGSGKAVESGAPLPRARTRRSGTKSKKDTSAYTRGLEKKSPKEQMQGCDYSGWMKKKSSNLMTTWKPRLFVLRGRRLSYYYSENDTEERGLIDITAHRVLRADNDPIVALHATLTGSTASPTSPSGSNIDGPSSDKASGSESSLRGSKAGGDGPFFYKLVPPKSGTSRTVQFTKPAIHYFQVDSVQEGRLWMAALMKATIERDMELPVETTNKQKTISLKEARLMNQRPPALMATPATQGTEVKDEQPTTTAEEGSGLMIQGLGNDQVPAHRHDGKEDRPPSPLDGLDVGPLPLFPESVAKID